MTKYRLGLLRVLHGANSSAKCERNGTNATLSEIFSEKLYQVTLSQTTDMLLVRLSGGWR